MQKYEGSRFFSSTDLVQGYWQVPLARDSRKYTSFYFNNQLYQFCIVPFGLKTSGPAFIRALSLAVHKLSNYVTSHIDHLLVASRLFDEHVEYLENLFICIKNAGFT